MCLAQVSIDGSVCLEWGMLFVPAAEGRLLIVGLGGFGLWWRHNVMIGSMMEVVFDMLVDVLVLSVGMKGSSMMMMMVVVVVVVMMVVVVVVVVMMVVVVVARIGQSLVLWYVSLS
jgi:hypothetical protein